MGKRIDRAVLGMAAATLFYLFFLNAWGSIPLACGAAFACCLSLGRILRRRPIRRRVGARQARTELLRIAGLPDDFEGYTILVLSDLHGDYLGDRQVKLLNIVTAQSYDIAILCGDMVGKKGDDKPLLDLLAGMATSRPTFFIAGDEDPQPILNAANGGGRVKADYVLAAESHGAVFLDRPQRIQVGKSAVWLMPESI